MRPVSPLPPPQVERWFAAIDGRRSRRSFDGHPLNEKEREAMEAHCASFRPFPAARSAFLPEAPEALFAHRKDDRPTMAAAGAVFLGIMGSYGRIDGAPAALAFAGRVAPVALPPAASGSLDTAASSSPVSAPDDDFAIEEQIGYAGEAALLEATALGLDTCWVAGFFSPGLTESLIGADVHETALAVSPLGHAVTTLSRKERYVFQMGRPKKRLRLEHIALGLLAKDWPPWAVAGIRAVHTAPSAMNRQPWRFRLDKGTVLLACDRPDKSGVSKRIDCGIAMLHFELGVRHAGKDGVWEPPGTGLELDVARWRPGRRQTARQAHRADDLLVQDH